MSTVWIVLSSKPSNLTMSVISLNRTHVLMSFNVISPSSGRDVTNVSQWTQGQDVRHATMVTRVMEMEVVFHVHLMNVVLRTSHMVISIVYHGRNVSQNAWCVQKGITLMMMMVHVWNVRITHVVQETLTIIPVLKVVSHVQMIKWGVIHVQSTQH